MTRHHNNRGLRKLCACTRARWPKCPHAWHFNFKPRGGASYRFSLDAHTGTHIASKTEAEALADDLRTAIRSGTFRQASPTAPAPAANALTFAKFTDTYAERCGKPVSRNMHTCMAQLAGLDSPNGGRFGDRPLAAITEDEIETIFGAMRAAGKAASTRNKYIQTIKALFRWAVRKGYLTRNPADSDALKREKHAKRDRRLEPDVIDPKTGKVQREGEERRLLAVAYPSLQRLIIAALESGARKGELLGLTWRDVDLDRREMTIRAETTKTRTARVVPLSGRLVAALTMARHDPAGKPFGPEAHVFGDGVGGKLRDVKRPWETAVLKAHGHTPVWRRNNTLAAESLAALAAINLRFHDLRHEAGSRLLEAGWPLHQVAHMLGHANVSQTSTYLNATRVGLQEAMRRLDTARGCNPVANERGIERAPLRNEAPTDGGQDTVN